MTNSSELNIEELIFGVFLLVGVVLVVVGVVSLLLLVMIGLTPGEPILYGIFLIIGTVFLGALNIIFSTGWIGAGATLMWFIIAVILIVFKGGDR